ncbi:MAG: aspartyl protease family protein [Pseudomonadota bacterium]
MLTTGTLIGTFAVGLIGSSAASTAAVEPPAVRTAAPVEAVAPNLSDPTTEVLDIEKDRNNRYTVPVMVEGSGPYDFMIDTGSQATAVTHQINEGLELTPFGTATLVGMASRRPVEVVEVASMTFGTHTVTDLLSPVLDRRNVGADGILGLDSLQDFRVLIDFRDETIAVQDMNEVENQRRGFEIVVRARQELGQLLITDATIEGVRATVIIDTGAQASIGNPALQERIRTKRAEEIVTTDVNGVDIVGELSFVRSLKIEGLSLQNVPLTFADAPAFQALGLEDTPVIALGMQHLRIFDRVAIDFSNQRVLFDVPRDVARDLRRARRQGSRIR